jgi:hypothetical protein
VKLNGAFLVGFVIAWALAHYTNVPVVGKAK